MRFALLQGEGRAGLRGKEREMGRGKGWVGMSAGKEGRRVGPARGLGWFCWVGLGLAGFSFFLFSFSSQLKTI